MKKILLLATLCFVTFSGCSKKTKATFTITWNNYDGSLLTTSQVEEGSKPEYKGETPTKDSDKVYSYRFKDWDPKVVVATQDATYTATFESVPIMYKITFNADGGKFESNQSPTLVVDNKTTYDSVLDFSDIEKPTKKPTATEEYEFDHWVDKDGNKVTSYKIKENATFTAVYTKDVRHFKITFNAGEGYFGEKSVKTIEQIIRYDVRPTEPVTDPTRDSDATHNYTFKGYDKDVNTYEFTDDTVINAEYDSSVRKYHITFNAGDGHFTSGKTIGKDCEYGEKPEIETPIKDKVDNKEYIFSGWEPEFKGITEDSDGATYTAKYIEAEYNEIEIHYEYYETQTESLNTLDFIYEGTLNEIDWGDETTEDKYSSTHTYTADVKEKSPFIINIKGFFSEFKVNQSYYAHTRITRASLGGSLTKVPTKMFYDCSSLTEVNLDKSITRIEDEAFSNCSKLNNISFSSSSITYIGKNAFYPYNADRSIYNLFTFEDYNRMVYLKNPVSPSNPHFALLYVSNEYNMPGSQGSIKISEECSIIANNAFENFDKITAINIPNSVEYIGNSAFMGCKSIEKLSLPENLLGLYDDAFAGCTSIDIDSFSLPDSLIVYEKSPFDDYGFLDNIAYVDTDGSTYIPGTTNKHLILKYFGQFDEQHNVEINEETKIIKSVAFLWLYGIENITIPKNVVYIDPDLVTEEQTPYFPNDIKVDKENQYYYGDHEIVDKKTDTLICSSHSGGNVIEGVKHIRKDAIRYTNITTLNLPHTLLEIENDAIRHNNLLEDISIPASVCGFNGARSISLNECELNKISVEVGSTYYSSLENDAGVIYKPTSILLIGTKFATTIPSSIKIISNSCFAGARSLENLTFSPGLLKICKNAFVATKINKIILPNTVKELEDLAFNTMLSLTYLYIPNSVEKVASPCIWNSNAELMVDCQCQSKPSGWQDYWFGSCNVENVHWGVDTPKNYN